MKRKAPNIASKKEILKMNRLIPLEKPQNANGVLRITSGRNKGKQLRLFGNKITVGRHSDCDIVMKDNKTCSRKHALIIRKNNSYSIESLKTDNPVLINNQPVETPHILKEGDIVILGDISCVFTEQKPLPARLSQPGHLIKKSDSNEGVSQKAINTKKRKIEKKPNFLFVLIILGLLGFLFLSGEDKKTEDQTMKIKTEKEVNEELEAMKKINKEEEEEIFKTAPSEGEARIAFIKGFRDYRKGYYHRAEKHFNHCLTLNQKYEICASYVRQSRKRIERLIQRKMILGKEYRQNSQYKSCAATFQSVEIMVRDTSHILFKEARENRKFCEMKIHNRI